MNIYWQCQGRTINVVTEAGSCTLYKPDAQSRADILALLNALCDAGQGVGGGWPVAFTRGWV